MPRCAVLVIVTLLLVIQGSAGAPPPLRLTIDCPSGEGDLSSFIGKSAEFNNFDLNSFCRLIHNAIPQAVKDGKFIVLERTSTQDQDQVGFSNNQVPFAVAPPKGFFHKKLLKKKLKIPRIKVPGFNVPKLRISEGALTAPRVGLPMPFHSYRNTVEEESSAEKMEKFKKGVQKMLHVVKVMGQIDEYLSDRTRIIIDKLSKTFSE